MSPGSIIREARQRRGLTQAKLALRAGTRQSAISRLEKDEISPSVETLELLLNAMGETLVLGTQQMDRDYDPLHREAMERREPAERLAVAVSWNRMAGRLRRAGQESGAGSATGPGADREVSPGR
jgi:transcriptional regulator with XRE-family HTH domain